MTSGSGSSSRHRKNARQDNTPRHTQLVLGGHRVEVSPARNETKVRMQPLRQVGPPLLGNIRIVIALIHERCLCTPTDHIPLELPVNEGSIHRIKELQIE